MARIGQNITKSGKRILLVDDQEDYRLTTAALLEREGHEIEAASNGEDALELIKQKHFDLLLLDYFMPGGMTGEETIVELRKFNTYIQIILQTGYAGEIPPREMLQKLDIQGYHDKTDGPDKLLLWIDVGLKAAFTVQHLQKSRQSLRYILDITPDLHKIQQIQDLLQGILLQVSGLLGIMNSFIAILPDKCDNNENKENCNSFIAIIEEMNLSIKASTGRFANHEKVDFENDLDLKEIQNSFKQKKINIFNNKTIVPLCIGNETLGIIYLEQDVHIKQDIELLNIFANQAAVAIQNARLYEMATLDPLTGVYVRRFFDQWFLRELRTSLRGQQCLSLLMIDIDKLKLINDSCGHLSGDFAITTVGKILKQSTRSNDFVCRYGGDEFAILLPNTPIDKVKIVTDRIETLLKNITVKNNECTIPIRVSIGISGITQSKFENKDLPHPVKNEYFEIIIKEMIKNSDEMLYKAKKDPDQRVYTGKVINWPEL